MNKTLLLVITFSICFGLASCGTQNIITVSNDDVSELEYSSNVIIEPSIPSIESFKFEVNDDVLNSVPNEFYYQIADISFSPTKGMSVLEFLEHLKSSKLYSYITYNICEDDIRDVFAQYSPEYLVGPKEQIEIYFYYDGKFIFGLKALNITKNVMSLKDCYAFDVFEGKDSCISDHLNTDSLMWLCKGINYKNPEYNYTSIKVLFEEWGCEVEEISKDSKITVRGLMDEIKIDIKSLNGYVRYAPYYEAEVNKATGEVEKLEWTYLIYTYGVNSK